MTTLKHFLRLIVAIFVAMLSSACNKAEPLPEKNYLNDLMTTGEGAQYLAHEVVVKISKDSSFAHFRMLVDSMGATIIDSNHPLASKLGFHRIQLPEEVSADEAISHLMQSKVAAQAERNYIVHTSYQPNDPYMDQLWGMEQIRAIDAWDLSTGAPSVVVAVTDTGVDTTHPDLVTNAWSNPDEIPANGIDDDSNGYVDDTHGWDWVGRDADPFDDHGHGTHCSGTIAGIGDNGIGVAGVTFDSTIMPLKFLNAAGSGTLTDAANAILYAADKGAQVVNASWGCAGCYTTYVEDAIIQLGQTGGLFVAAAGNSAADNDDTPFYPAAYDLENLIAVAATDSQDALAYFSNWGQSTVHLAAPGVDILSTFPYGGYQSWQGTSMAAPHVAGAAALYLSLHPVTAPDLLKGRIVGTSTPLSSLTGKVVSNGRLDVFRLLTADSVPPAAPTQVEAHAGIKSDVTVTWAANTEPDLRQYRVLWGTSPGLYFGQTDVNENTNSLRVTDLENEVTYRFAVQAADDSGNFSGLSQEVTATPGDQTPPPQVIDLVAYPSPGPAAPGSSLTASSEISGYYQASNASDGNPATSWITAPALEGGQEHIVVDLGSQKTLDRAVLQPDAAYPEFFPVDFDLDVSQDGSSWTIAAGMRDVTVASHQTVDLRFSPVVGRYVRLRVLESYQHVSGFHYVGLSELSMYEISTVPDQLTLEFTAPGDDPGEGAATSYDIRISTDEITEPVFGTLDQLSSPLPALAGAKEYVEVNGLAPETEYSFALIAMDEAGNESPMSNVASSSTIVIPPGAVTDLSIQGTGPGEVTLAWTAVGSDGLIGTASQYDIRYSLSPIHPGNVDAASQVPTPPIPNSAGSSEVFTVAGLSQGDYYYFSVRSIDASGAIGGISNVVSAQADGGTDLVPPAAVPDLDALPSNSTYQLTPTAVDWSSQYASYYQGANIADGNISTLWLSAYGSIDEPEWSVIDLGETASVTGFATHPPHYGGHLQYYPQGLDIELSADGSTWTPAVQVTGLTAQFGVWDQWSIPSTPARYARINVTERGVGACQEPYGCIFSTYVGIAEFKAYADTPEYDLQVLWVAPGDDDWIGTASQYDLRRSDTPITESNFDSRIPIQVDSPQPAGYLEIVSIPELEWETVHYFALKTADEAGNWSGISNIASVTTPGIPPAPVDDLIPVSSGLDWITLQWTASGDDGLLGTALEYDMRYSKQPIDFANWDSAFPVLLEPPPAPAGSLENITVDNLDHTSTYYFALKVIDDMGNASIISNVAVFGTLDGTPPGAVSDLTAATNEHVMGSLTLTWTSPGDDDFQGVSASYDIRISISPITDDATFQAASQISAPTPDTAGTTVELTLSGLDPETTYYAALKTSDESGNTSVLSNIASAPTRDEAPAPISDLTTGSVTSNGAQVAWTATGDDGFLGTATSYDLRVSAAAIDENNYNAASPVSGLPIPLPSGTTQSSVLSGLNPATTYYLAMKVMDDKGNESGISNLHTFETDDDIPPSAISDLAATPVDPSAAPPILLALEDSSSSFGPTNDETMLWDGDPNTTWISAASSTMQAEYLEFNLPSKMRLGSLRLVAGDGYEDLFPVNFLVKVMPDHGDTWMTVVSEQDFTTDGSWESWALGAVEAVAVRMEISETTQWTGTYYAAIGELELYEDPTDYTSIRLSWSAPGDDGASGQAQSYDLRHGPGPIMDEVTFAGATSVPSPPAPQPAGSLELHTAIDLAPETEYCFAAKADDDVGNTSPLSNSVCATTPGIPPGTITDLRMTSVTSSSVVLEWTAPGEDGHSGQADSYELVRSPQRINEDTWNQDTIVPLAISPAPAGGQESFQVTGLTGDTKYVFAIRATDSSGNQGSVSNNATAVTSDDVPPSGISDLAAQTDDTQNGAVILSWTAPGDTGLLGQVDSYDFRMSPAPIDQSNFESATPIPSPTPATAGTAQSYAASGLPQESPLYFAAKAVDAQGNTSQISNIPSARTRDVAPDSVSDLSVVSTSGDTPGNATVTVAWTASGDNATAGTATAYDLRYATSPMNAYNFSLAQQVSNTPSPAPSGESENHTIQGLPLGQTLYFALVVIDDRGNESSISNVVSFTTADAVPPGQVQDLFASTGSTPGTLALTWTSPGDDGFEGNVYQYSLKYSLDPIDESNFASASLPGGQPSGGMGNTTVSYDAFGLPDEAPVHVAFKARDNEGNWSAVSNDAVAWTPDVAPARTSNLIQVGRTTDSITVAWTAPGDNGTDGTATSYDLRYSSTAINNTNFDAATQVITSTPQPSGSQENATITGLSPNASYFLALITTDDRGNQSTLSNVISAQTSDDDAPGRITDLTAAPGATQGTIKLSWTSPGDDGYTGTATTYHIRRHSSPIDETNWDQAAVVPGVPTPAPAGTTQYFTNIGLAGETQYHFALLAEDDESNLGPVSVSAQASTLPIAPSPIVDLSAAPGSKALVLSWTATGDDGAIGTADHYEIRYAPYALDSNNFDNATLFTSAPVPSAAGTPQTTVIAGLDESTQYWAAIIAFDENGASSGISNVADAVTLDETAPAAPSSLNVSNGSTSTAPIPVTTVSASSFLGPGLEAVNAIDGDPETVWVSSGAAQPQVESLTVDLGSEMSIDRVEIKPHGDYLYLFPRAFSIATSVDGSTWEEPVQVTDFQAGSDANQTWAFSSRQARFLELRSIEPAAGFFGLHYTVIAEINVLEAAPTHGSAHLSWIAPGDDGNVGTAAHYEVFYSETPFDETSLHLAQQVSSPPSPASAGNLQAMLVAQLPGETTLHWALRAIDEASNTGPLSTLFSKTTAVIPPSPIGDLEATSGGLDSVDLTWTATGDDGSMGSAALYELRYAAWPITSENFPLATDAGSIGTPSPSGAPEGFTVTGLLSETRYYFAIVAEDEAQGRSYISNVVTVRTDSPPDNTAPDQTTDLQAAIPTVDSDPLTGISNSWTSEQPPSYLADHLADGDPSSLWSNAPSSTDQAEWVQIDFGAQTHCETVRVIPADDHLELFPPAFRVSVSPDGLNWTQVAEVTNAQPTLGDSYSFTFPVTPVRYVEFEATALAEHTNGYYYATVAEVAVFPAQSPAGTVIATWTAPGDDGASGTADSYDLRLGSCPYDHNSSTPVATGDPSLAGSTEEVQITDLSAGTYCLGLTTEDESGNVSPLSNTVQVDVLLGGETCGDGTCTGSEDLSSCPADCDMDLAVIVETSLMAGIQNDVDQYVSDLQSEGKKAVVSTFAPSTAQSLKATLQNLVVSSGIEGAFLLGDLPAAWYEQTAFGTHEEFPCDLYLMDLDATWSDTDSDGILDGHSPLDPDIYVSRITGSATEISYYLQKAHAYRAGASTVTPRAYVFKDDDWSTYYPGNGWGLDSIYGAVDSTENTSSTTRAEYISQLTGGGAEFVYQWIHSNPDLLAIAGTGGGTVTRSDITSENLQGVFYNLFDCSAARFSVPNLAMTYLTTTDSALATIGSTKTGGIYMPNVFHQSLADASTWGEAYLDWYNQTGVYNDEWHLGIIPMGDPALQLVATPTGNTAGDPFPLWTTSELISLEATMAGIAATSVLDSYSDYVAANPQFF